MQEYFGHVIAAEETVFGRPRFLPPTCASSPCAWRTCRWPMSISLRRRSRPMSCSARGSTVAPCCSTSAPRSTDPIPSCSGCGPWKLLRTLSSRGLLLEASIPKEAVAQTKEQEIRYTRNDAFDDAVARKYLDRKPSARWLEKVLSNPPSAPCSLSRSAHVWRPERRQQFAARPSTRCSANRPRRFLRLT